jgi:microcystin-dependent protein
MSEPMTVNKGLIIPNSGDLPGTWGSAAINPDMAAIDGMLGGFTTLSLSNSNVTLTVPVGFVATPSTGPTQSQNALITFTGVLSADVIITFPMPGFYVVENLCTVGAFVVKLASSAPGKIICAPPGEATHIFCNGTDVKYVDLGRVGTYIDLAASAVPRWITQCTVAPYLNCDGTTFSAGTYPALNAYLGGTTLPDLRGRLRAALDQGTGRVTTAGSGVDGSTLLAAGGSQNLTITQSSLPNVSFAVTIPAGQGSHAHDFKYQSNVFLNFSGGGGGTAPGPSNSTNATIAAGVGVQNQTLPQLTGTAPSGGTGSTLPSMNPVAVAGLTLIRAG